MAESALFHGQEDPSLLFSSHVLPKLKLVDLFALSQTTKQLRCMVQTPADLAAAAAASLPAGHPILASWGPQILQVGSDVSLAQAQQCSAKPRDDWLNKGWTWHQCSSG